MNGNKQILTEGQVKSYRRKIRRELADRDLSVNELASQIGRPRTSVSKAINKGIFPRIREKIEEALSL